MIPLIKRIDIHMIERHRQRQAQPQDPFRHFQRRPGLGRRFPRVANTPSDSDV